MDGNNGCSIFSRSTAGNRMGTQQRWYFFPPSEINVISDTLPPLCVLTVLLHPFRHIMVRGQLTLFHTNKNSAGNTDRNFLQPVIATSQVQQSSSEKVPSQHFSHSASACKRTFLILLDNTRKTIEIYERFGCAH